jgi:hypothetical protein
MYLDDQRDKEYKLLLLLAFSNLPTAFDMGLSVLVRTLFSKSQPVSFSRDRIAL